MDAIRRLEKAFGKEEFFISIIDAY